MTTTGRSLASNALGQRPLGGVDQQQDAVGHAHHPLDLAAEVGVAGRVDDVDLDAVDGHGDVLGEDGDAALALQVVGVEDQAVLSALELVELFLAKQAGLAQHVIDQRCLAVVNVSNDGYIANVSSLHIR
jgi:hypothetical protein